MKENHVAKEASKDEHYRHYCYTFSPDTGDMWAWASPEGQKFFHLVLDEKGTDPHPHNLVNAARLQNFKRALKKLKIVTEEESIKIVELPKLGFHLPDQALDIILRNLNPYNSFYVTPDLWP